MRVYAVDLEGDLFNIRNIRKNRRELYNLSDYKYSQDLAGNLRNNGCKGIVYKSVRDTKGECGAIFRPKGILTDSRHFQYLIYKWDGKKIVINQTIEMKPYFQ